MSIISKFTGLFKKNDNRYISSMGGSMGFYSSLGEMQPTDFEAQVRAYRSWVFACVSKIAGGVAQCSLRLYHKKGEKIEEITEHPFLDLMKNVNPFMNEYELKENTVIFLKLTGNCYWYPVSNGLGVPAELWVIPAQQMKIIPDKEKFIKGYMYQRGMNKIAFDETEIIHFKEPNPHNLYYGMGPLVAAAYAYDINRSMKKYEKGLFKNLARPDAVLKTEQNLNEEEIKKLREQWHQVYGGVKNVGKVGILTQGTDIKPLSFSPREIAFLQGSKVTRDEIAAIFGVPKSMLTTDDVNRANAQAGEHSFAKNTVLPVLRRIQEKINEKLLPRYDKNLFCKFDSPVPEDEELRLKTIDTHLRTGYSSINEERQIDGQEEVEWGKTPYLPLNLMPIGSTPEKEINEVSQKIAERVREKLNAASATK